MTHHGPARNFHNPKKEGWKCHLGSNPWWYTEYRIYIIYIIANHVLTPSNTRVVPTLRMFACPQASLQVIGPLEKDEFIKKLGLQFGVGIQVVLPVFLDQKGMTFDMAISSLHLFWWPPNRSKLHPGPWLVIDKSISPHCCWLSPHEWFGWWDSFGGLLRLAGDHPSTKPV